MIQILEDFETIINILKINYLESQTQIVWDNMNIHELVKNI